MKLAFSRGEIFEVGQNPIFGADFVEKGIPFGGSFESDVGILFAMGAGEYLDRNSGNKPRGELNQFTEDEVVRIGVVPLG